MVRKAFFLMSAALITALCLPLPAVAADTYVMSMALGGTTGGFYRAFTPIADYINTHTKVIRVIPTTSGGSVENAANLASGASQIAPCFPEDPVKIFLSRTKDIQFAGPGMEMETLLFVVLKKSGITDISGLRGKKVALGARGATARSWATLFLKEVGILDKIVDMPYGSEEIPDAIKNGDVDAFAVLGSGVIARIQEVAVTNPVGIIDLTKELEQTGFLKKYPWYTTGVTKAGVYKGQDKDSISFGTASKLFTNKKVPDYAVYEFMKYAYSPEAQPPGTKIDYKSPAPLANLLIPVHAGAQKYWKERGIEIPKPMNQ